MYLIIFELILTPVHLQTNGPLNIHFKRIAKRSSDLSRCHSLKKISIYLLVFSLPFLLSTAVTGQFTNISSQLSNLNIDPTISSHNFGSGLSFYDFDNDGWDDLTISGTGSSKYYLKNNNGVLEMASFSIPSSSVGNPMSIIWIDFDNDGDADFFATHHYGPVELWENDGDFNFTNITGEAGFPTGNYRFTNSAWGDYNHDGYPDLYLTMYYTTFNTPHEEYSNQLYQNNGDGTFTNVTEEAGVFIPPSTTLQAIWVDLNNDGWEDLFVAEDKLAYPNELFINNQDGTFTRTTLDSGVGEHFDAMSAAVSDFNQDGFLDIYVTNNPYDTGNRLYKNNGDGTFSNVAVELGVNINSTCWGAVWMDFNNDIYEDLFVGTASLNAEDNHFFVNEGELGFDEQANQSGLNNPMASSYNCARGDLNNDGFFELALANYTPQTHQLYSNQGNSNNWFSVTLEGTIANRDGLGTWIKCYFGGECYVKYTLSSENLGGQNSRKNIYGLGTTSQVDSLVLEWNSGTREVYVNPDINTHHIYVEGASFNEPFALQSSGSTSLCVDDSLVLTAGDYQSYLWNNGDTTQSIVVTEPGEYSVEVINEFGLSVTSIPVEVAVAPPAIVTIDKTNISCTGANDGIVNVTFSNGPVAEILWNTGDTIPILENLGPDLYSFAATDDFGCPVNGLVSIAEPSPLLALGLVTDVMCYGESTGAADLNIIGGTPPYSIDWLGENQEALYAGIYEVIVSDMNGCTIDITYEIDQPDSLWVELETFPATDGENGSVAAEILGGTPPFELAWSTGDSGNTSLEDLAPGEYSVLVTDANGCEVMVFFEIDTSVSTFEKGKNELRLFPNPAGAYTALEGAVPGSHLRIYDLFGRVVLQVPVFQSPAQIDVSDLPSGQYVLRVGHNETESVLRLVLVK